MLMYSEAGTVPSSQRPLRNVLMQAEPSLRPGTTDLTLKREEMMPDNLRLRRCKKLPPVSQIAPRQVHDAPLTRTVYLKKKRKQFVTNSYKF
ncbi:hypothetical protein I79_005453 [Cricetulus griseus]|uniref:Uncharacterized protein n=1 Tax=Cricetulus griseus TaxID=10029 RepID=G3H578_CRIGR|nr:hypothetical protein I79_005453 [Cricetulus griseus]